MPSVRIPRSRAASATPKRSHSSKSWSEQRKRGEIPDQLLIVEHPHVITLGRNGHLENLLASDEVLERAGIAFHHTDRGGDITYHGPARSSAIRSSICENGSATWWRTSARIEQVIIDALADFGIEGRPRPGLHRRVGGRQEDRRHRRPYQPLGHLPRLRAESYYRFELFPVHRALRADQAGDFHASSWARTPRARK